MADKIKNKIVYNAAQKSATLFIYDVIGPDWWDGGITGKSFDQLLKSFGAVDTIDVWIDSPGGNVWDGIAIYNTLNAHAGKKIVHVIARAFSAASVIAMAGDEIHMAENSVMMIHEAASGVFGGAADMRKEADMLETINATIVKTYAARTKQAETEVAKMMSAETWMSAEKAKESGFATHIVPNKSVVAHYGANAVNQTDPSKFKNVPDWVSQSLTRLSEEAVMSTKEKGGEPVMFEAKPGFTYRLGDDGKLISEPVKPKEPENKDTKSEVTVMTMAQVQETVNVALTIARERDREITAVCTKAGVPHMAVKYIDDPKITVGMVKDELLAIVCARNPPVGPGDAPDPSAGTPSDPVLKWKKEYADNKAIHMSLGISEDDYIKSQKISAGMPV